MRRCSASSIALRFACIRSCATQVVSVVCISSIDYHVASQYQYRSPVYPPSRSHQYNLDDRRRGASPNGERGGDGRDGPRRAGGGYRRSASMLRPCWPPLQCGRRSAGPSAIRRCPDTCHVVNGSSRAMMVRSARRSRSARTNTSIPGSPLQVHRHGDRRVLETPVPTTRAQLAIERSPVDTYWTHNWD